MQHFTLETIEIDYGLTAETTEILHISTIGLLTVYNARTETKCTMQGVEAQNSLGAMLEALEYIQTAKRNSKTLQIVERVKTTSGEKLTGRINFDRFKW